MQMSTEIDLAEDEEFSDFDASIFQHTSGLTQEEFSKILYVLILISFHLINV